MTKKTLSKEYIVAKSAELFRLKSFTEVSMRDIAKTLDVKAASLYNHIKSKQEILELIIFELVDMFMTRINKTYNKDNDIESKLIEIIQTHIEIAIYYPNAFATLNNDWKYLIDTKKQRFISQRIEYENTLKKIIIEGQNQGVVSSHDPDIIIYMMLTSLRTLHLWYERQDQKQETLMNEIPKLILGGILS
jgi:AcrR family transcriptional regulator